MGEVAIGFLGMGVDGINCFSMAEKFGTGSLGIGDDGMGDLGMADDGIWDLGIPVPGAMEVEAPEDDIPEAP